MISTLTPLSRPVDLSLAPDAQEGPCPLLGHGESFYQGVLESLSEGVIISDSSGRVIYANRLAAAITGHAVSELLGADIRDILYSGAEGPVSVQSGECPD